MELLLVNVNDRIHYGLLSDGLFITSSKAKPIEKSEEDFVKSFGYRLVDRKRCSVDSVLHYTGDDAELAEYVRLINDNLPPWLRPRVGCEVKVRKPKKEEKAKGIRSIYNGLTIEILTSDREEQLKACLHELGHAYWEFLQTSLKKKFSLIFKKLTSKRNIGRTSILIKDSQAYENEEEFFCYCYYYVCLGSIVSSVYLSQLEERVPEVFEFFFDLLKLERLKELLNQYASEYIKAKAESGDREFIKSLYRVPKGLGSWSHTFNNERSVLLKGMILFVDRDGVVICDDERQS